MGEGQAVLGDRNRGLAAEVGYFGADAPDRGERGIGLRAELQAGGQLRQVLDAGYSAIGQVRAGGCIYGYRNFLDADLALFRGDHDLLQLPERRLVVRHRRVIAACGGPNAQRDGARYLPGLHSVPLLFVLIDYSVGSEATDRAFGAST